MQIFICVMSSGGPPPPTRIKPITSIYIIRSYHGESTGSHPNSEVKHHWACSVLRWGTTWESQVSNVFVILQHRDLSPIAHGEHPIA